jgi:glycosyltransferase involved in cell wall biosynthesis
MVVIPNGFDLSVFRPNPDHAAAVRDELMLDRDAVLLGIVGRFDPAKDHKNFIAAAALVREQLPNVHFLLCGDGVEHKNLQLSNWIADAGLSRSCHLLGGRNDMPRIMASLDILVSSSYTEGFSNVIGEAMSSGVPCVVTDVGDSAFTVGSTGRVVKPSAYRPLADACLELLKLPATVRRDLGLQARNRIAELFEISSVVKRYTDIYEELAQRVRHSRLN